MAGLGYDWHNIMHMIAAVVSDGIYQAMSDHRPFDASDYCPATPRSARRLAAARGTRPAMRIALAGHRICYTRLPSLARYPALAGSVPPCPLTMTGTQARARLAARQYWTTSRQ